jgi:hypothetical protein
MINHNHTEIDLKKFEDEWVALARKICQAVYVLPEAQKLKHALQNNGFLSLEEKSEFIRLCDEVKYKLIYEKYGQEDTESYKTFSQAWQQWFSNKGVESQKDRTQRSSVDHILFGSTPDPVEFLLHFEEEILGSMK